MRFTRAGEAAAALAASLLIASAVFRDVIVGSLLLIILAAMAAELLWVKLVTRNPSKKFSLLRVGPETGARGEVLYPGDVSVTKVLMKKAVGGKVELVNPVSFAEFEPRFVHGAMDTELEVRFSTEFAGEYSGNEVSGTVSGPLGLFTSGCSIPFPQRYIVYPRVLQVAAATVKLLGRSEIGETPIQMPGVGSEYYEMREYQPGDDYRNVNWKASARRGELMVVERMREVGSSFLLVLDARSPGFRETDLLASTFLTVANSLGGAGMDFGVIVHDGRRVIDVSSQQDPRASLALALKAAVGLTKLEASPEFLELVPLGITSKYAAGGGFGAETSVHQISGLRRAELKSMLEILDPWSTISRYVGDTQTKSVVYVSGVFGGAQPLIELAWEVRHYRDCEFTVANPCDRREDESNRAYRRVAKAFATAGVSYQRGEPVEVARKILAS